jgi:hypothetical protein
MKTEHVNEDKAKETHVDNREGKRKRIKLKAKDLKAKTEAKEKHD